MSTTLLNISINFSTSGVPRDEFRKKPRSCCSLRRTKIVSLYQNRFNSNWVFQGVARGGRDGIWVEDERLRMKKRVVLVKGFGFNGGGGGGGGRDSGMNGRLLGNIALAVGLTYLSLTGQIGLLFDAIGWVVDTVVSITLFAVLLPILGLGAFLWWAGRDRLQGTCPNCGNSFQILKSTVNNEVQLCPFCTQPFSVEDDKFVSEPVMFSNQPRFGQMFNDFSPPPKRGNQSSAGIVDIEAEVKDAD